MQCALGDKAGDVELFQVRDNRGNLSLADHQDTGRSVTVPIRRGDEILNSMGLRSSLAKIDVEGAEPFVIAGLGALQPDIILFEFAPKFIRALKNDPEVFLNSLLSTGYALEFIDPYKHTRTRLSPPEIMTHTNQPPFIWNILALRDEFCIKTILLCVLISETPIETDDLGIFEASCAFLLSLAGTFGAEAAAVAFSGCILQIPSWLPW
jgi:hypothetical protein